MTIRSLFILLTVLVVINGCDQQDMPSPSGNVVKIGFIGSITGAKNESAKNALLGIQTALQLTPYLKNGDKVELVIEDSKNTPMQTEKALVKLCGDEDVLGILLMAQSNDVLKLVPVADKCATTILALNATHPQITDDNEYISQLSFDDKFQGTVAALYVMDEMLIDSVAVISNPENSHYNFLASEFIRKYSSLGGRVVEHIISDVFESTTMQDTFNRLQEENVRMLYLAVEPKQILQIARLAKEMRWAPLMMGSDGLLSSILLLYEDDLDLVDGMLATDIFSSIMPPTVYGKKAYTIFKKVSSESGTTYSALGCEGASILMQAMDRCNNIVNKSCTNYMLRSTKGFEGLHGKITIQADGKAERPIFINVIDDHRLKFLVKVY